MIEPEIILNGPELAYSEGPTLTVLSPAVGGSPRKVVPAVPTVFGENEVKELQQQGFTQGLADAMITNNASFPLRIWVVDNSGSMKAADGHRLVETRTKYDVKIVNCTRWKEIQETVIYHSQMAALLQAPTLFRMLNDPGLVSGPQEFSVAQRGKEYIDDDLSIAFSAMQNSSPRGVTPLAQHVRNIEKDVRAMQLSLEQTGARVAVVLATDGLPTDFHGICTEYTKRDFTQALRSLEGLPVWVVIRLCTDDEAVVNFYNELDSQLELSLEVLDDFTEEAKEVNSVNKWMNYCLPLHRCREMGYSNRLFDLMDERKLTKDELRDFLVLLFGQTKMDGVPDAHIDWKGFCKAVSNILRTEKKQWNPRTKRVEPWIDMRALNKAYGKRGLFRKA